MDTNRSLRRPVYRALVTVEILVQDSQYDPASLEQINYDIIDGDWIGDWSMTSLVRVPEDAVEEALIAIGNDGTFFDSEGDNYQDDEDPGYRCPYGCGFETHSEVRMSGHLDDGCSESPDDEG